MVRVQLPTSVREDLETQLVGARELQEQLDEMEREELIPSEQAEVNRKSIRKIEALLRIA